MYNCIYIDTQNKFESALDHLLSLPTNILGCDSETTGLDCHTDNMRLFQIAYSVSDTYVFDLFRLGKCTFSKHFNSFLNQLLKSKPNVVFSFHNYGFDLKFLWALAIDLTPFKVFDTMLASLVIGSGLPNLSHNLGSVVERFLDLQVDKTEQKSDWGKAVLTEDQKYYAAKDAAILRPLSKALCDKLIESDLMAVFRLEMQAVYAFASMEYYGMRLDLDRLSKIKPIYEQAHKSAAEEFLSYVPSRKIRKNLLGQVIDEGFNISSSSQVLSVLRELNVPNPLYDSSSEDPKLNDPLITSTSKTTTLLLELSEYPVLESLMEYNKYDTLLTRYIYNLPELINPLTGRIHTSFRQIISTGRSSSSNPNLNNAPRPNKSDTLDEEGIPLNLRSCFKPEDGFVYAMADYSQIELRVIAEVSKDESMLSEFINLKDPYANTAALLNGYRYEDIVTLNESKADKIKPEYKGIRQSAKAVRLGLNYGMWWKKLSNYCRQTYGVVLTKEEAKSYYDRYFEAYPGLKKYHDCFKDKNIREARTLAPFKRRRLWSNYPGVPQLSNHPIQGTAGDIQKLAMALIYFKLWQDGFSPTQDTSVRMVLTVHDELELEAHKKYAGYAREVLQSNMIKAGESVIKVCPILADAAIVNSLTEKD